MCKYKYTTVNSTLMCIYKAPIKNINKWVGCRRRGMGGGRKGGKGRPPGTDME